MVELFTILYTLCLERNGSSAERFKTRIQLYTPSRILSVCLFVCPIITHESLDRFVSTFDWGNTETHGNVLSLVLSVEVESIDFNNKNLVSR